MNILVKLYFSSKLIARLISDYQDLVYPTLLLVALQTLSPACTCSLSSLNSHGNKANANLRKNFTLPNLPLLLIYLLLDLLASQWSQLTLNKLSIKLLLNCRPYSSLVLLCYTWNAPLRNLISSSYNQSSPLKLERTELIKRQK